MHSDTNRFFVTEPCIIQTKCEELEKDGFIFSRSNSKIIKTYIFNNKLLSGSMDCEFLLFDIQTNTLEAKYKIKVPQFLTFCLALNPELGLISCNSSTLFLLNLSKQTVEQSIDTQETSIASLESIPNQQILLCLSEISLVFFQYPSLHQIKKLDLQNFFAPSFGLNEGGIAQEKLSVLNGIAHNFMKIRWNRLISKVKFTSDFSVFATLDNKRKVSVYSFENLDYSLGFSVDKVKVSAFCLAERGEKYLLVSDFNKKLYKICANTIEIQTLGEFLDEIQEINLDKIENFLIVCFSDFSISLLNSSNLEKLHSLAGIIHPILSLVYIPENFLIICHNSHGVYLFKTSTKQYTEFIKEANLSCCLTPDFQQLIIGNSSLSIFEVNSMNLIRTIKTGLMSKLRLEPQKRLLVFINSSNDIVFWQYSKPHERLKISFTNNKYISTAIFSKSKYLLTVQETGTCNIWRLKTIVNELPFEFHSSSITCAQFSENEDFLLTGSLDSKIVQWDFNTCEVLKVFETDSSITSLALHSNNDSFVAGHSSGSISTWSISRSQKTSENIAHTSEVSGLKYFSISFLISVSKDNSVKIIDLMDFSIKKSIQQSSPVFSLDLSLNQKYFAICSGTSVKVYLANNPEKSLNFVGHKKIVYCVCVLNRTQEVLSGSFDNAIRVWSVSKKKCEKSLSYHTACVWSLKIMPSELIFISCSWDNKAVIWDACVYEPLHSLNFGKSALWGVELASKSCQALFFLDHNFELRDLKWILKNKAKAS